METLSECSHSDSGKDNSANPEGQQLAPTPVEPQSNGAANVNGLEISSPTSANNESGRKGDEELSQEESVWWSAVKKNSSDFTSWTCLLQKIEQKVSVC